MAGAKSKPQDKGNEREEKQLSALFLMLSERELFKSKSF